jgi:hypothetical protein
MSQPKRIYIDATEVEYIDATPERSVIGFRSGRTVKVDYDVAKEIHDGINQQLEDSMTKIDWINPEEN